MSRFADILARISRAQGSRSGWIASVVPGVLLLLFLALGIASGVHKSYTYDEPYHFRYGMQLLDGDASRFDDSKMPISALNALPKYISRAVDNPTVSFLLAKFASARFVTLLGSSALAFLCFHWSRQIYGYFAGSMTLFLYVFEPNILAHSRLVTTDTWAMATATFSIYALWLYTRRRDLKHGILLGGTLGISQLAKYTGVLLYPLVAALLFVHDSPQIIHAVRRRKFKILWERAREWILLAVLCLSLSVLIINAGFLFQRTMDPISTLRFRSGLFQSTQATLASVYDIRIPLPYPYLEGLDWVYFNDSTNFQGRATYYLLGELGDHPFPGYYLIAFLFKVPLATQAILILATLRYFRSARSEHFVERELFLLGPAVFFAIYFNMFNNAQLGFRFFLIVLPFLLIFAGNLFRDKTAAGGPALAALALGAAYLLASVGSYFPHYLSYFNELVVDRTRAYTILADSNLDWGQNEWYLERYLESHPRSLVEPNEPTPGTIIVSANKLIGIIGEESRYAWLRENFDPVGTVAYSYLVFDVSEEDLRQLDPGFKDNSPR